VDEAGLHAAIATLPGPQQQALRSITATGRRPRQRAFSRSRSAQSDHASSMDCARCAAPWPLTMRWPSRLRPRGAPRSHQRQAPHATRNLLAEADGPRREGAQIWTLILEPPTRRGTRPAHRRRC
jgi:hypothetical protein